MPIEQLAIAAVIGFVVGLGYGAWLTLRALGLRIREEDEE